ncbi:MAG: hypothetical protein LWW85_04780 [Marinilabiliales bacterium]|nr:hypothetical protein [Marinilabiliales bacterium]
MRHLFLLFGALLMLVTGVLGQSAWKSPDYQPMTYEKLLVIAKIQDDLLKRQLEDQTVRELGENGIRAIPSYANLKDSDEVSDEAWTTFIQRSGIDATLIFTVTAQDSQVMNGPSTGVHVGVPVHLGRWSVVLGGNIPITGSVHTVNRITLNANFFPKATANSVWIYQTTGKEKDNKEAMARAFARKTVKEMLKAQICLPPAAKPNDQQK